MADEFLSLFRYVVYWARVLPNELYKNSAPRWYYIGVTNDLQQHLFDIFNGKRPDVLQHFTLAQWGVLSVHQTLADAQVREGHYASEFQYADPSCAVSNGKVWKVRGRTLSFLESGV